MSLLWCYGCGEHHENGGEALRCDHERHIERLALNGALHRDNAVRGCPTCEEGSDGLRQG